jgi:hypothetical protein
MVGTNVRYISYMVRTLLCVQRSYNQLDTLLYMYFDVQCFAALSTLRHDSCTCRRCMYPHELKATRRSMGDVHWLGQPLRGTFVQDGLTMKSARRNVHSQHHALPRDHLPRARQMSAAGSAVLLRSALLGGSITRAALATIAARTSSHSAKSASASA